MLNMLTVESTITLPYLWGRTVGKAAKTEPSKPLLYGKIGEGSVAFTLVGTWHVTHNFSSSGSMVELLSNHHPTSTPLSL